MRFNAFYKIIDQITEMDLPGEKVQLLMAPPFREYLMEKFKRSTIKAMPAAVLCLFYPNKIKLK